MRRMYPIMLALLAIAGIVVALQVVGATLVDARNAGTTTRGNGQSQTSSTAVVGTPGSQAYLYYTLKQSDGFVLARAPKGASGQPLSAPQPVAHFGNGFGMMESDNVLFMQPSPDGNYVAIDGTGDHGEQVWLYDIQHAALNLVPAYVMGNFLHWMPVGHIFLYRPMFPLGPSAPMDGNGWNPGLWKVDAAMGTHINIDIQVPSAYLIDAAPSPDGTRIIYSTTAGLGLGSQTWEMNSDGSGRTRLFTVTGGAQSITGLFTWSPDGQMIAYEQLSDSSTPFLPAGLWVMNGQGAQQHRLADTDGGHGYAPAWSPDDRKLAYVVRANEGYRPADTQAQALQSAIAVVDVGSGQSWRVASADQTGMQLNINPTWSADSASVTFTALNPANRVLGGTPRYWSARAIGPQFQPAASPLTPALSHIVAAG